MADDGLQKSFKELGVRDGTSPSVSLDLETMTVSRILMFDWGDLSDAMWQLLGYSYLNTDNTLHRYLPQEDWNFPGLFASKVTRVNGLSWVSKTDRDGGSTNVFDKAVVQVDFMPRPYSILPLADIYQSGPGINEFLRYVEVETAIEGDYLTVPVTGLLAFNEGPDAGLPFPGNLGRIVCAENYVFRWHQIPDLGIPEGTILDTMGHVNKTDFGDHASARLFFPAGTLLLLGAGWRRIFQWTPSGIKPAWVIEYTVKYVPQGHNQLLDFHASPMDFYQISRGDGATPPAYTHYAAGSIPDGQCVYDEAEFADLFNTAA